MIKSLTSAIQFLTIIHVPGEPVEPGRAAAWFPLVGAALGIAGAGIYLAVARALPSSLAALACVAFWTAVSGVLHEDGLADVADALRAGRSRERMLTILKDSRIGTFGAVAIILSVLWLGGRRCNISRGPAFLPCASLRRPFREPPWWVSRGPRGQ